MSGTSTHPAPAGELEREPLCPVKWCPFPTSPEFHECWCGRLDVEHHHVDPRGMGGSPERRDDPDNIQCVCPPHHKAVTTEGYTDEIKDGYYIMRNPKGAQLVKHPRYRGEPTRRLSAAAEADIRTDAPPSVSVAAPSTKEESDEARSVSVLSDGGRDKRVRRDSHIDSPSSQLTHEQRVAIAPLDDWCRRGMGFVYNGERLEVLTDEWRWQVGEWLNEGEGMMPEEVHGYLRGFRSPMALRQYAWVAGVITRVTGLSWTHHRAVAALPAPERQEKLEKALTEGLSTRAMMGPGEHRERHSCPSCGADHQVKS